VFQLTHGSAVAKLVLLGPHANSCISRQIARQLPNLYGQGVSASSLPTARVIWGELSAVS